jgi:hypothetical protein
MCTASKRKNEKERKGRWKDIFLGELLARLKFFVPITQTPTDIRVVICVCKRIFSTIAICGVSASDSYPRAYWNRYLNTFVTIKIKKGREKILLASTRKGVCRWE